MSSTYAHHIQKVTTRHGLQGKNKVQPFDIILEKEMTTHSSILAWEIMDSRTWWTAVHGGHKESDTI